MIRLLVYIAVTAIIVLIAALAISFLLSQIYRVVAL